MNKLIFKTVFVFLLPLIAPCSFGIEQAEGLEKVDHIDPKKLKTHQLHYVLNGRGIDHITVFDKLELLKLIDETGPLTEEELEIAEMFNEEATFYTKDFKKESEMNSYTRKNLSQILLIQVSVDGQSAISDKAWHHLVQVAHSSGIYTGQYNEVAVLTNKNIHNKPYLMLACYDFRERKREIFIDPGHFSIQKVYRWMKQVLMKQSDEIFNKKSLETVRPHKLSRKDHKLKLICVYDMTRKQEFPFFFATWVVQHRNLSRVGATTVGEVLPSTTEEVLYPEVKSQKQKLDSSISEELGEESKNEVSFYTSKSLLYSKVLRWIKMFYNFISELFYNLSDIDNFPGYKELGWPTKSRRQSFLDKYFWTIAMTCEASILIAAYFGVGWFKLCVASLSVCFGLANIETCAEVILIVAYVCFWYQALATIVIFIWDNVIKPFLSFITSWKSTERNNANRPVLRNPVQNETPTSSRSNFRPTTTLNSSSANGIQTNEDHNPPPPGNVLRSDMSDRDVSARSELKRTYIVQRYMEILHNLSQGNLENCTTEEVIRNLPRFQYQTPDEDKESTKDQDPSKDETPQCAFCLENYVTGDWIIELPCGHYFHEAECVEWLKAKEHCSLCRRRVQ